MTDAMPIDPRPARDGLLTSREVASVLLGLIGGYATQFDVGFLRDAIRGLVGPHPMRPLNGVENLIATGFGGVLGAVQQLTTPSSLNEALHWIAATDAVWKATLQVAEKASENPMQAFDLPVSTRIKSIADAVREQPICERQFKVVELMVELGSALDLKGEDFAVACMTVAQGALMDLSTMCLSKENWQRSCDKSWDAYAQTHAYFKATN